ncbi:hypothetical protein AAT19DRAFT_12582 [Rhodotorula toruloides]|uniref:Uncharacterized protein n=1 Tax=Rhodotorula toruloides TaxID=5286 RepID=A0A2T0AGP5_RHOTO|nr:hypothetical protein AAT19DRAFT_12582 [Rhodotorula toruloides]
MANFSAVEQRVAAMSYDQVLDALHEGPRALVLALPESFRDQLARTVLETGWRAKEVGRAEGRLEWRKDSIDAKLKLFGCSARSPGNEVLECIDTLTSLKYEGSSPELECKALVEAGSFEALAYQTAGFSVSNLLEPQAWRTAIRLLPPVQLHLHITHHRDLRCQGRQPRRVRPAVYRDVQGSFIRRLSSSF